MINRGELTLKLTLFAASQEFVVEEAVGTIAHTVDEGRHLYSVADRLRRCLSEIFKTKYKIGNGIRQRRVRVI
jgi:hypothetical protein